MEKTIRPESWKTSGIRGLTFQSAWRAINNHHKKRHRLRLHVDDCGSELQCVFCGVILVSVRHDLADDVAKALDECGIEFEVQRETAGQSY